MLIIDYNGYALNTILKKNDNPLIIIFPQSVKTDFCLVWSRQRGGLNPRRANYSDSDKVKDKSGSTGREATDSVWTIAACRKGV